jgi:hypothetical protein
MAEGAGNHSRAGSPQTAREILSRDGARAMTEHNKLPTIVTQSNSLADLAARINAEHVAAEKAYQSGVEHALQCGDLLLEAKALLPHGQWLPWLESNCSVSSRSARLYMQLARNRQGLEAKSATVANLTMQGALQLLEPPRNEPPPEGFKDDEEMWEWAGHQVECPFSDWDFNFFDFTGGGYGHSDSWLTTKLLHKLGVPAIADFCMKVTDDHDLPDALAMCPMEEIDAATRCLVPVAKGKERLALDVSHPMAAGIILKMMSQRLIGMLFREIESREGLSDEQLIDRADKTHAQLMVKIDAALADVPARVAREIAAWPPSANDRGPP